MSLTAFGTLNVREKSPFFFPRPLLIIFSPFDHLFQVSSQPLLVRVARLAPDVLEPVLPLQTLDQGDKVLAAGLVHSVEQQDVRPDS